MAAKQVYRDLMKAVRKHTKGDHFTIFISHNFRDADALKDCTALRKNLELAQDYAFLVKSVHAQKELLISYNIGVDREVEQAVRMKNTAERVGLSMPNLFQGDEQAN